MAAVSYKEEQKKARLSMQPRPLHISLEAGVKDGRRGYITRTLNLGISQFKRMHTRTGNPKHRSAKGHVIKEYKEQVWKEFARA